MCTSKGKDDLIFLSSFNLIINLVHDSILCVQLRLALTIYIVLMLFTILVHHRHFILFRFIYFILLESFNLIKNAIRASACMRNSQTLSSNLKGFCMYFVLKSIDEKAETLIGKKREVSGTDVNCFPINICRPDDLEKRPHVDRFYTLINNLYKNQKFQYVEVQYSMIHPSACLCLSVSLSLSLSVSLPVCLPLSLPPSLPLSLPLSLSLSLPLCLSVSLSLSLSLSLADGLAGWLLYHIAISFFSS